MALTTLKAAHFEILLFLDGLNESGRDGSVILEFLDDTFRCSPALKVCVSSRPEQIFVDYFSCCSRLRLQDLNAQDIDLVISQNFFAKPAVVKMLENDKQAADKLRWSIRSKAEGVFLWVRLAIHSLFRGMTNRDDVQTLEARLDDLPSDLDSFYSFMLSRQDGDSKFYRAEAAFYFKLLLYGGPTSLPQFCLAINTPLRTQLLRCEPGELRNDVVKLFDCQPVKTRVTVRTAGLLEIVDDEVYPRFFEGITVVRAIREAHHCVHASNYLLSTSVGQDLLSSCTLPQDEIRNICLESTLVSNYIILCLMGKQVGMYGLGHSFSSWLLSFPDFSHGDIQTAEEVFARLLKRGSLLTSHFFLPQTFCNAITGGHLSGRFPFPLTKDDEIDLVQILCMYGFYQQAQSRLRARKTLSDVEYLARLVPSGIYRSWPSSVEAQDIMRDLIEQGVKPSVNITLSYGEPVSLSLLVLDRDFHLLVDDSREADEFLCSKTLGKFALSVLMKDLAFFPLIADCDYLALRLSLFESPDMVAWASGSTPKDPEYNSIENYSTRFGQRRPKWIDFVTRIYVTCTRLRGDHRWNTELPLLYGTSPDDSDCQMFKRRLWRVQWSVPAYGSPQRDYWTWKL